MTSTPSAPSTTSALERLLRLVHALRDRGLPISPADSADFVSAAELCGPAGLYWAGRACLVRTPDAIPVYDDEFLKEFTGTAAASDAPGRAAETPSFDAGTGDDEQDADRVAATLTERLEHTDFAALDADDARQVAELLATMTYRPPLRTTLRRQRAPRGRVDLRRTVAELSRPALEHQPRLLHYRRRRKPRRLVLVLDTSRSMAPYSRPLLIFSHTLLRCGARVDVHCFSTRLTDVTTALHRPDLDEALAEVADRTPDRAAGTRIGAAIETLADSVQVRGAVVVILSDGLEIGPTDQLAAAMPRLRRLAARIVWVNPLKGDRAYEPLQAGMRAALPHVDEFVAGHDLSSLRALSQLLARDV